MKTLMLVAATIIGIGVGVLCLTPGDAQACTMPCCAPAACHCHPDAASCATATVAAVPATATTVPPALPAAPFVLPPPHTTDASELRAWTPPAYPILLFNQVWRD
ncbi:MAG TPA: hypothetical protein PKM88_13565 [bacterium]|nr:hypothetical protein [bacterium]